MTSLGFGFEPSRSGRRRPSRHRRPMQATADEEVEIGVDGEFSGQR